MLNLADLNPWYNQIHLMGIWKWRRYQKMGTRKITPWNYVSNSSYKIEILFIYFSIFTFSNMANLRVSRGAVCRVQCYLVVFYRRGHILWSCSITSFSFAFYSKRSYNLQMKSLLPPFWIIKVPYFVILYQHFRNNVHRQTCFYCS